MWNQDKILELFQISEGLSDDDFPHTEEKGFVPDRWTFHEQNNQVLYM